jgi:hypothetical protein
MMLRILAFVGALFSGGMAFSTPYWIAYEGNDYPENEGWTRYTRAGGAQRSLVDGSLVIDSMASQSIVDEYYVNTPIVLAPAEQLRVEWRARIDHVVPDVDPAVSVAAAPHGRILLSFAEDHIVSDAEVVVINFAPGVYHDYVLTSADLTSYTLSIDGAVARVGHFVGPSSATGACWGDCIEGGASISTWDRFAFGVVPEPTGGLLLGFGGTLALLSPSVRRTRNEMDVLCAKPGRVDSTRNDGSRRSRGTRVRRLPGPEQ